MTYTYLHKIDARSWSLRRRIMEPIKRKKTLEQAYQSVADGFSGKKENSCYEPIFVLDEEWNTLKQEGAESPLSKEEITNQRATWDLTHEGEVSCATYREHREHKEYKEYKEYKEHKQAERKQDWNQWEALKQLRINPRIPLK